jgi:hypothetical protein
MPGIWWLQYIVHCPVPRLNSTRQPEHSSGVEEKRSKWSSLIRTIRSASATVPSQSPQSNTPFPDDVRAGVVVEDRRVRILRAPGVDQRVERLVLDLDQLGASRASSRVAATTAATGSPTKRVLPTASA